MKRTLQEAGQAIKQWVTVDLAYYIRNGSWTVFANIFITLVSVLAVALFSRVLPPELYGKYRFFTTVIATLGIMSLPGMSTAILRSAAQGKKNAYYDGVRARARFTLLGSLLLLFIAAYMFYRQEETWYLYLIAAPCLPFIHAFDSIIYYCYGKGWFRMAAAMKFAFTSGPTIGVILVLALSPAIGVILLMHVLVATLIPIAAYLWMRTIHPPVPSTENAGMRHYGTHISVMEAASMIYTQIDKFILTYLLGFTQLALYAIAQTIPDAFKTQAKVVFAVLLPKFSRSKIEFYSLRTQIAIMGLISVVLVSIAIALTPPVVHLVFTKTYEAAARITQLLLVSTVFWLPALVIIAYLESQQKVKELYAHRLLVPVLGIALYAVLIPLYGMYGAVYAILVTEFFSFVLLYLLAAGVFEKPLARLVEAVR